MQAESQETENKSCDNMTSHDLSPEILARVATSTENGIILTDAAGLIQWANEGFTKITGFGVSDISGKKITDLVRGSQTDLQIIQYMRSEMLAVRGFKVIHDLQHKNGEQITLELEVQPLRDAHGLVTHFMAVERDVTQRKLLDEAIAATARQYRQVVEHLKEVIFQTDMQGYWIFLNPAWTDITGYSCQESIGTSCLTYVHPDDLEMHKKNFAQLISGCKTYCQQEFRILSKNGRGKFRWVEAYARLVYNDEGQVSGLTGTLNDVTDRKNAEIQLKHTNGLQRAILNSARASIISTNSEGIIETFNPAAEEMLGYTAEEMIGRATPALFHDTEEMQKRAEEISAEFHIPIAPGFETFVTLPSLNLPEIREWTYVRKDGSRFPVSLSITALRNDDGKISGYLGIATDITEHKQILEELKKQQSLLSNIISNIPFYVFWKDRNCRYVGCNPAFAQVSGFSDQAEIVGKTDYDLPWTRTEADAYLACDQQVMVSGQAIIARNETQLLADGKIRHVEMSKIPLRDSHGKVIGLLGVYADVTQRHQAEIELRKAKEDAESANQAKSTFLATMSHEIRTPLNGVNGTLKLLETSPLNEQQKSFIKVAQSSAHSLLLLINDILDFSKIEAGHMEMESIPFNLPELMQQVMDSFKPSYSEKGLVLSFQMPDELHPIRLGDPTRLRQILTNLIGNALKFTERGRVDVKVSAVPGHQADCDRALLFEVMDTGIGIAPDRLGRLFHSFSQVDSSTTRKYGGTGLGLAISHHLVQLMGGDMGVNSTAGQGSTFYFTVHLPCTDKALPSEGEEVVEQLPKGGNQALQILLAEDNDINQLIVKEFLRRAGYDCDVVGTGTEALAATEIRHYDLILMDCQMPEMDGFEACRQIRQREKNLASGSKPTYIVALTANALKGDREVCLAAGMDDYLVKPLEPEALQRVLMRLGGAVVNWDAPISTVEKASVVDEPAFNTQSLQQQYAPDLLEQVLGLFDQQVVKAIESLHDSLDKHDTKNLAALAHRLRGSARFVAAGPLAAVTQEIETLSKAGELEEVTALMGKLEAEIHRCQEAIPQILSQNKNGSGTQDQEVRP